MTMPQQDPSYEVVHRVNRHVCDRPSDPKVSGLGEGDIIKCKICRTQWKCTGTSSGTQWDPYDPVLKWERYIPQSPYYGNR